MAKLPVPLWLDCDTGHDDAFALLLAAHHPSLRLLGVSTIYGNAPLPHTTHNTCAILAALNREDVPVYPGADKPFCRAPAAAPDIHGVSGLDGTTCLPEPRVPARTDRTAVDAMAAALRAEPAGTAWLVATGSLTNAALLFALYPDLAAHVAGVSIMGGALGGGFSDAPMGTLQAPASAAAVAAPGAATATEAVEPQERFGNHTPWAEFNIYLDPESASAVFANPVLAAKTTLVPLDLTHQFLATKDVQRAVLWGNKAAAAAAAAGDEEAMKGGKEVTRVRRLFHEILIFFAQTYADVFGLTAGPPTHDPLAVAVIFAPELFSDGDGERFAVQVVTEGEHGASDHAKSGVSQCGRTIATLLPAGDQGVRIPRSLQADEIWRILEQCLTRVDESFNTVS